MFQSFLKTPPSKSHGSKEPNRFKMWVDTFMSRKIWLTAVTGN